MIAPEWKILPCFSLPDWLAIISIRDGWLVGEVGDHPVQDGVTRKKYFVSYDVC